jgi:hypothetical protein
MNMKDLKEKINPKKEWGNNPHILPVEPIGMYGMCQCGKPVSDQQNFCSNCGSKLNWITK